MQTGVTPAAFAFGPLLKRFRTRAKLSQEQLAERAELSVEAISSLERGVRRNPYPETVTLLAAALMLPAAECETFAAAALRPAKDGGPAAIRSSLRPVRTASGNLPLRLTSFVGRRDESLAIRELLRSHRLVTLTGAGGAGKTRISLEVAASAAPAMPDGVWLAEFGALTDAALVPTTIATALQCRLAPGESVTGALASALARKTLLLVLDNCEHVIDEARTVAAAILAQCPGITLIATSRRPLGISGEAAYRIPSMPETDALALFDDRARTVAPAFALDAHTTPIAEEICRRLDGIPLAIELAASRIPILTLADLRDRLDNRFRLLTDGSRDALPRQQTLRALIDWSYDLLNERERRLFRRVSVFAGGFRLEAAAVVCGDDECDELDVLETIASLVDASLIVAVFAEDETRYRLYDSTRLYAGEQLEASGERADIESRHIAHFAHAVGAAERFFEKSGSDAQIAPLVPEIENVRAALRYAMNGGDMRGATLATAASRLFVRMGLGAEGVAWLDAAIANGLPDDLRVQSRLWDAIGYLIGGTGGSRSLHASERAVGLARAANDRALTAWTLTQYAAALMSQSRGDDAEAALAEAEVLFGYLPQPHQRARILAVRSHIVRLSGDLPRALAIGIELTSLYRRLGNESGEFTTTLNTAETLHAAGETHKAIELVRDALQRASRHRETHGCFFLNLTAYLAASGDADAAFEAGTQAIRLLSGSGCGTGAVATAIGHLSLAHALRGDLPRAARLFGYWDAAIRALSIALEPTEQQTLDRVTALLAAQLPSAERAALQTAGALLDAPAAIDEALERSPVAAR